MRPVAAILQQLWYREILSLVTKVVTTARPLCARPLRVTRSYKPSLPHKGASMSRQPTRDAKEDSADYWLAQANKAVPADEAKKTEAQLLEANLEKVREDAKKLEETRWLFEERPADPLSVEASVGL